MRGKLWFIGGLAVGFVLGARAGREKYEELVVKGRKILDHPTVQEAAGVAQAQVSRLYAEGKNRLSHSKLGAKLSTNNGSAPGTAGRGSTYTTSSVTTTEAVDAEGRSPESTSVRSVTTSTSTDKEKETDKESGAATSQ